MVQELAGVDTVVFLMGINDIISGGSVHSAAAYGGIMQPIVAGCHGLGKIISIGTLPPAGGYAAFDADPAKEALRQAINGWIRRGNGADGVIDFDAALADPADPVKLRAEYQSDWLHPNDAGYRKMAETAAGVLAGQRPRTSAAN